MTILEHRITRSLAASKIVESDRVILGDFNDNPYAVTDSGNREYSNASLPAHGVQTVHGPRDGGHWRHAE